jgi:hypothetical protein
MSDNGEVAPVALYGPPTEAQHLREMPLSEAEIFTTQVFAAVMEKNADQASEGAERTQARTEHFYQTDTVTVAIFKRPLSESSDDTQFNKLTFYKQDKAGKPGRPVMMDAIFTRVNGDTVRIHYDHSSNRIRYMAEDGDTRLPTQDVENDEYPRIIQTIKNF